MIDIALVLGFVLCSAVAAFLLCWLGCVLIDRMPDR